MSKWEHPSDRQRDADLRSLYGITFNDLKIMHAAQKGLCAICDKPIPLRGGGGKKGACVDHCHYSNAVRKLLCTSCNIGLSFLENAEWYERAVSYLATFHAIDAVDPSRGCVYKQKGSRFWWIQYYRCGKRIRQSTKTSDLDAARAILQSKIRMTIIRHRDNLPISDHRSA